MAEAARGGLSSLRPDARPFVISRAGYAGLQQHALQWTGDNSSWWEHLWMSMPQLQNLGLSGIAWCGVDVGGFFDDCNGELLARWTEFGAFQPFCRNHSAMGTARRSRGRSGSRGRACAGRCSSCGCSSCRTCTRRSRSATGRARRCCGRCCSRIRTIRHLHGRRRVHGGRCAARGTDHAAGCGAPARVSAGGLVGALVDERARIEGPAHVLAHAPLGQPAVYARCDTPIPLWPVLQHTDEVPDFLTWRVFPGGGSGSGALYEDSGDGYGPCVSTNCACERRGWASFVPVRSGGFVRPGRRRVRRGRRRTSCGGRGDRGSLW